MSPRWRQPAEVLIVSQFTLYGNTEKGRRPSWIDAARPEHAEPLVEARGRPLASLGCDGGHRTVPHRDAGRARQRRPRHADARAVTPSVRQSTPDRAEQGDRGEHPRPVAELRVPRAAAALRHVHRDHPLLGRRRCVGTPCRCRRRTPRSRSARPAPPSARSRPPAACSTRPAGTAAPCPCSWRRWWG